MFKRAELLKMPLAKVKTKAEYMRAAVHGEVLNINIYKNAECTARVFVKGKEWINYIPKTGRWNKSRIDDLRYNPDLRYDTVYLHDLNKSPDVEVINAFFNAKDGLYALKGMQCVQDWSKEEEKQEREAEKRRIYKAALSAAHWPELTEEEKQELVKSIKFSCGIPTYIWYEYKEYCEKGYCPVCQSVAEIDVLNGLSLSICGNCGHSKNAKYIDRRRTFDASRRICVIAPDGENAAAVIYMATKTVTLTPHGRGKSRTVKVLENVDIKPIERYLFTKDFSTGEHAYYGNLYGARIYDDFGICDKVEDNSSYQSDADTVCRDLSGTVLENSHIQEIKGILKHAEIKYAALYLKHPNIENLVVQGFSDIVKEKLLGSRYYREINLKEKKPAKILGLTKPEALRCKAEKWDLHTLQIFKKYKAAGFCPSKEELKNLSAADNAGVDIYSDMSRKFINFAKRQAGYWYLYKDYLNMAEKNGEDITSDIIKYPKNISAAHEKERERSKFLESEKLKQGFSEIYTAYMPLARNNGEWCIRPAASEAELINEGAVLCHCVGGYGKRHTQGESIFFVRQAKEPDVPLYTLQVDLRTGRQIQLHGYKNELSGCVIDEGAKAFIAEWLKKDFVPYDFETKKLKKEINKNGRVNVKRSA